MVSLVVRAALEHSFDIQIDGHYISTPFEVLQ